MKTNTKLPVACDRVLYARKDVNDEVDLEYVDDYPEGAEDEQSASPRRRQQAR